MSKDTLKLIILLIVCLLSQPAQCKQNVWVNFLQYDIDPSDHTATCCGLGLIWVNDEPTYKHIENLTIPETISFENEVYTVTKIGKEAFAGWSRSYVSGTLTLPSTLTVIEERAFAENDSLTGTLIIPNSVTTIGKRAFYKCRGFTGELTLPNSLTAIGEQAFSHCEGITSLKMSDSVKTTMGIYVFDCCTGLTNIVLSNSMEVIEGGTFSGCSSLNGPLVIPNSVEKIGYGAFGGCSQLSSLKFGENVTVIEAGAFVGCSQLSSLKFGENVTVIEASAFKGCKNITGELVLPKYLTTIGDDAFRDCKRISGDLRLPNTLTHLGKGAFYNCRGLNGTLTIPESITSIVGSTFFGTKITTLYLPATIEALGTGFIGEINSALKLVVCEAQIPPTKYIDEEDEDYDWIFYQPYPATLLVPKNSVDAYKKSPYWKDFFKIEAIEDVNPVISIELDKTEVELSVGDEFELHASITPTDATDNSLTWHSSDETVATVNANGMVSAVAVGTATITATAASGVEATCVISVVEMPAASIRIDVSGDHATIRVNETFQLTATIFPAQTTNKTVTWSSSDENIASVDASGLVLGRSPGVVTITATAASGVRATCIIAVINVTRSEEQMVIMDGEKVKMSVDVEGVYARWLNYEWINNGQIVGRYPDLYVTGHSDGNSETRETYTVHVLGCADWGIFFDETYQFTVETWPRPSSSMTGNGFDDFELKVRENTTIELSVNRPEGGYSNWNYLWTLDGREVSTGQELTQMMTMAPGNEMAKERSYLVVTATNIGPKGDVWGEARKARFVMVYRRPLTPSQLIRKGDGTTHTLIAMSQLSDDELARLNYQFVYGYTDAMGVEYVVATTAKRYCRFDESIFNDANCEKWVYTQWCYDDGSVVTSGRRYLGGNVDEDFDASDFSGNARPQNVTDFSNSDNWIISDSRGVTITVANPDDTCVEVFTTTGQLVKSTVIPANTFSSVDFGLGELSAGFYIVSVSSGESRAVKKVLIK